jgi:TRAP-type C4-dicarboxylate transport system permease small subunit
MKKIRAALDALYAASGAAAVLFLILIAVLTLAQIAARLLGTSVPSADDFAGFCMAGCVFLGMTHTLRSGGHIRVLTLLAHVPPGTRRVLEIVAAAAAVAIVGTLTWYAGDMLLATHSAGEYTLGQVPVPKWIPMLFMLSGLVVFLVALVDELLRVLRGEKPLYVLREEESTTSITSTAE